MEQEQQSYNNHRGTVERALIMKHNHLLSISWISCSSNSEETSVWASEESSEDVEKEENRVRNNSCNILIRSIPRKNVQKQEYVVQ